jgi:hypothetical protein
MGRNKKKKKEKRNIKNKGTTMFGFGKKIKETVTKVKKGYTPIVTKPKVEIPTVGKDSTTLSAVLFKQSVLDEIAEMCLPKAGGSEFQVHYRSLQIIVESQKTGNRMVVTLPTVFFNMPQKVSTASVDFNLDEIAEISKQIAPISEKISEKYLEAFPVSFFESIGMKVSAREAEIGSLHRHPGNFGFSSTDLDNRVEEPGIIFRSLSVQDRVQVDSVMYIPGKSVQLVTTETRVVNVEPTESGGIHGSYLQTPTISCILDDTAPEVGFEEFFGEEEKQEYKFITGTSLIQKKYKQFNDIFTSFLNNLEEEYQPELIIDPELIESSYSYSYNARYGGGGRMATPTTKHYYSGNDLMSDYYEEEFYTGEESDALEGEARTTSSNDFSANYKYNKEKIELRRTWLKMQVVNNIRSRGIKVEANPMITGDASESDIIAIVTETKLIGWTDAQIRVFFSQMNYPKDAMDTYYRDLVN